MPGDAEGLVRRVVEEGEKFIFHGVNVACRFRVVASADVGGRFSNPEHDVGLDAPMLARGYRPRSGVRRERAAREICSRLAELRCQSLRVCRSGEIPVPVAIMGMLLDCLYLTSGYPRQFVFVDLPAEEFEGS